jgi:aspartate carbamoyltransferase catalytic subunit
VGSLTDKNLETNYKKSKNIINIDDFSKIELNEFISLAEKMKLMKISEKSKILENKTVASLFFEPSTRTRLSFETAIGNLGAKTIGFSDSSSTSAKKGETLSDTITMIEKYADAIVMRHKIEGAAKRASEVTKKAVINAGDGANQHPTQTLLDIFTIKEAFGGIDGLNIGLLGDLKYGRTVHSLASALDKYEGINLYLISPKFLAFPKGHLRKLKNIKYIETKEIESVIDKLDVLYVTRIQQERFSDPEEYEKIKDSFVVDLNTLKNAKDELKIMHPLPRVNELSKEIDDTKYQLYFTQAENGLYMREALLSWCLKGDTHE